MDMRPKLVITPEVLAFEGRHAKDMKKAVLTMKNPQEKSIIFKIKCSHRRHYDIKPKDGAIMAGQQKDVTFMFRDCDDDEKQPDAKLMAERDKHRFQIVLAFYPESLVGGKVKQFWDSDPKDVQTIVVPAKHSIPATTGEESSIVEKPKDAEKMDAPAKQSIPVAAIDGTSVGQKIAAIEKPKIIAKPVVPAKQSSSVEPAKKGSIVEKPQSTVKHPEREKINPDDLVAMSKLSLYTAFILLVITVAFLLVMLAQKIPSTVVQKFQSGFQKMFSK